MKFPNPKDTVQPRIWDGRPWRFQLKYLFARHPGIFLGCCVFTIIGPIMATVRYLNYEGSRDEAMHKFQNQYLVVRHDDERVQKLKKLNERGREHFPKY